MEDSIKNLASIVLGCFFVGLALYLLYFWGVPWYAVLVPTILFIAGAIFGGAGLSGME